MQNQIGKFGRILLTGGILFTQIGVLDYSATKVYAITNDEQGRFIVHMDKQEIKVDENVVLKITNTNKQDANIELKLSNEQLFNEAETKKMNENNKAIQNISVTKDHIVKIEKNEQSNSIGDVYVVIQMKKAGEYKFEPIVKFEGNEKKIESPSLHVGEKKEISEKVKVSEENKKQEINATNAEIPKETKALAKEKVNEELVSKENELKESNKVNENNQELPAIQAEKVLKSQALLAASPVTSILKYPNVKVINNRTGEGPSISGKYAFRFVWSPQVTYEVKGSSDDRTGQSQYTFRNSNREQYVLVKKAGEYQGKWIDIRINIHSMTASSVDVKTPITKGDAKNFLQLYGNGRSGQTYNASFEFYEHGTSKKVPLTAMWNFKRINSYKNVTLRNDGSHLTNLYVYDTSSIRYQDKGNNKIEFSGTAGPVATPEADMTITFDNLTELPLEVRLNASGVNVAYDQLAITQIEIPAPSVIGDIVEDNSRQLSYKVYQNMPAQSKDIHYAKSFVLESEVNKDFTVNDVSIQDVESGDDVSSFFDINRKNNKVTAVAKENALKTEEFNGKIYEMTITGSPVKGADVMKYYKGGYLEIPVSAKNYLDGDKDGQDSNRDGIAKIRYKGIPTGKSVPQKVVQGTDLTKMDISKFVTDLSVDTNLDVDKPISVVKLINIPDTKIIGNHTVTVVIETKQGVQAEIQVPVTVVDGTLKLVDVPKEITFGDLTIPSKTTTYAPKAISNSLKVTDDRVKKQKWSVYVKEIIPLTSAQNDTLTGALIYKRNGKDTPLSTSSIEVFSYTSKNDEEVSLNWKENEGIHLQVKPGPNVKANTKYSGQLEWTLTDAPL
ncbi:TPA: WxL domain-containing protein [Bacillus cereus]|uniref:WxL domain-containing protein n=1 Tax=Bacillus cereus TaxID=1396 RepID=UPI002860292C|nr:WxL domain-containing protein [Bacillus cereus]HDR3912272.1 WxL domain-containing protein [Bacillus cereus]HDV7171540.1 WxL domain-containing protein [Bacillus cereus]